jgi:hypothetical protein
MRFRNTTPLVLAGSLPTTPSVYKDPKLTTLKVPLFSDAPDRDDLHRLAAGPSDA